MGLKGYFTVFALILGLVVIVIVADAILMAVSPSFMAWQTQIIHHSPQASNTNTTEMMQYVDAYYQADADMVKNPEMKAADEAKQKNYVNEVWNEYNMLDPDMQQKLPENLKTFMLEHPNHTN